MQVNLKAINSAKKEILLTVEAERTQNAYRKYFDKAASEVSIPGFRPGKAPVSMVERSYGTRIKGNFYQDFVHEVFTEATQEHDLHFLMQPEIKEINWEPGQDMTIKIEIETEPEVTFKQTEGLTVPYRPIELVDEVEHYIEELRRENATMIDVDKDIAENDEVEFEVKCTVEDKEYTQNYITVITAQREPQIAETALGKNIGDTFILKLPYSDIYEMFEDVPLNNHEVELDATYMVNAIRRTKLPEIDDEFAKDLEFDNVQEMRKKISSELADKNAVKNRNIKINALITKLYVDNRFDLPENAMQYITEKELDRYKITKNKWLRYYELQIRYRVMQGIINMYLMRALRALYSLEPSEEDVARYIENEAKLCDLSVDEWKEKHKQDMEDADFKTTVTNYLILNKIADTCEFVVSENEPDDDE